MSRITVILHPNTTRVDVILNDRLFNQEKYSFSRKVCAQGDELQMLNVLNDCTVGIESAKASKNTLELEISDGMYPSEYIPSVIIAIKHFVNEGDYNPVIMCDDRREGVSGETNIGMGYQKWVAFN